MRVTVSLRVSGADLTRAELLTRRDFERIGEDFIEDLQARTDAGVDAAGRALRRGRTGKYLHLTGRFRDSIKPRRTSDAGTTIGSGVWYARAVLERGGGSSKRKDAAPVAVFGLTPGEVESITQAVAQAVEGNLKRST